MNEASLLQASSLQGTAAAARAMTVQPSDQTSDAVLLLARPLTASGAIYNVVPMNWHCAELDEADDSLNDAPKSVTYATGQ